MSFLSKLFRREATITQTTTTTQAGTMVNYTLERAIQVYNASTATKISVFYSAVDLVSSTVAKLSLELHRLNRAEGIFVDDRDNYLYYLLSRRPSERHNTFSFLKNVVLGMKLRGNSYAYIFRRDGEVRALILLSPGTCTYNALTNQYIVSDPYTRIYGAFPASDILHFRNTCIDGGFVGLSDISYGAKVLSLQATADEETRQRFAKGGKFKALYGNKSGRGVGLGDYSSDALEEGAKSVQEKLDSGRDIIAVDGEVDLRPLSMSSTDLQFLENRKFGVREICRITRVPPSKIFDDFTNPYNAAETANVEFLTDCIDPILVNIESELNDKLLGIYPTMAMSHRIVFDREKLFTVNLLAKADYQRKQLESGLRTVNELRKKEQMPSVEGGDIPLITCNVAPLTSTKITGEAVKENETPVKRATKTTSKSKIKKEE